MEIEATWADVVENLDETAGLARFAGPGGWNDADMLEVRSSHVFNATHLPHDTHPSCCYKLVSKWTLS